MKVVWEPEDIVVGRKVGMKGCDEKWVIGYQAFAADDARYCTISMLDHMVGEPLTKGELAQELTKGGFLPEELTNGGYLPEELL